MAWGDRIPVIAQEVSAERLGWWPESPGVWKHRPTGKLMRRPDSKDWKVMVLGGPEAIREAAKTGGVG